MSDFVKASDVYLDNAASTVDEALDFLSEKAVEAGYAPDKQAVLDAFKAREAEGTTGMMEGFAIPHAKSDAISKAAVIVVKFAGDVAWDSMDKKPINVAIVLCIPGAEAGTTHLKILSDVAVLLMNEKFRSEVRAATDGATIAKIINDGLK